MIEATILATLAAILFMAGYFIERKRNKESSDSVERLINQKADLLEQLEKKGAALNGKILDLSRVKKELEDEIVINKTLDKNNVSLVKMLESARFSISGLSNSTENLEKALLEKDAEVEKLKTLLNEDRELIVKLEDKITSMKKKAEVKKPQFKVVKKGVKIKKVTKKNVKK